MFGNLLKKLEEGLTQDLEGESFESESEHTKNEQIIKSSIFKDHEIVNLSKYDIIQQYEFKLKEKIDENEALKEQVKMLKTNFQEMIKKKQNLILEEEKYQNDNNIKLRLKNKKIQMQRGKQPVNSGSQMQIFGEEDLLSEEEINVIDSKDKFKQFNEQSKTTQKDRNRNPERNRFFKQAQRTNLSQILYQTQHQNIPIILNYFAQSDQNYPDINQVRKSNAMQSTIQIGKNTDVRQSLKSTMKKKFNLNVRKHKNKQANNNVNQNQILQKMRSLDHLKHFEEINQQSNTKQNDDSEYEIDIDNFEQIDLNDDQNAERPIDSKDEKLRFQVKKLDYFMGDKNRKNEFPIQSISHIQGKVETNVSKSGDSESSDLQMREQQSFNQVISKIKHNSSNYYLTKRNLQLSSRNVEDNQNLKCESVIQQKNSKRNIFSKNETSKIKKTQMSDSNHEEEVDYNNFSEINHSNGFYNRKQSIDIIQIQQKTQTFQNQYTDQKSKYLNQIGQQKVNQEKLFEHNLDSIQLVRRTAQKDNLHKEKQNGDKIVETMQSTSQCENSEEAEEEQEDQSEEEDSQIIIPQFVESECEEMKQDTENTIQNYQSMSTKISHNFQDKTNSQITSKLQTKESSVLTPVKDGNNKRIEMLRQSIGRELNLTNRLDKNQSNQQSEIFQSQASIQKYSQIQQYYESNSKLIEDFFVIGLDEDDHIRIQKEISMLNENPNEIYSQAKLLFILSGNTQCQRRKVVKDFCFPSSSQKQIELTKLMNQQEIHEIMYGQRGSLRRNIFIFEMQADDISSNVYQKDNVYHCICLINYEIFKLKKQGTKIKGENYRSLGLNSQFSSEDAFDYYQCPKAFVIMTKHPFFSFFADILCEIMQIYKLEVIQIGKQILSRQDDIDMNASFSMQVKNDIEAQVCMPVIVQQAQHFLEILEQFNIFELYKCSQQLQTEALININFNFCKLQYHIPLSLKETSRQQQLWHCPLIFSLLDSIDPYSQLMQLLCNILLEKSFIIVGLEEKNQNSQKTQQYQVKKKEDETCQKVSILTIITSAANLISRLINPLKWLQTQISILPSELIDVLDAPMPYMIGIRAKELADQLGSPNELDYANYIKGIDGLEDKCTLQLSPNSQQQAFKIINYGESIQNLQEFTKYLILNSESNEDIRQKLKNLLFDFQNSLKQKPLPSTQKKYLNPFENNNFSYTLADMQKLQNNNIYEPCYHASSQQLKICEKILDLLENDIVQNLLEPIKEMSRNFKTQSEESFDVRDSMLQKNEQFTLDEIQEYTSSELARQWCEGNKKKIQGSSGNKLVEEKKAQHFYRLILQTQNFVQYIEENFGFRQ